MSKGASRNKLISYVLMFICVVVFLFPVYWIAVKAFNGPSGIMSYPPELIPKTISLENFFYAEKTYRISTLMINTIYVSSLSLLAACVSSMFVAYGFARMRFPFKKTLFAIVLSSMMLPWDITVIPQFIIFSKLKMTNSYFPLILPLCFGVPLYIFLLRQFIMGIPYELDEAALIDGCGRFGIFARIIVPLMKPGITLVIVYQFLLSWNDFLNPLVYLNSNAKYTMSLGIYNMNSGIYGVDWAGIMAGGFVAIIIPVVVFAFSQKHLIEGIAMSGLKG